MGVAGGLNLYGFAKGDPVNFSDPFGLRPLTPEEIKQLGKLCELTDCRKIDVKRSPFNRSFTLGHTIRLSKRDKCDLGTLAHEGYHVLQWEKYGATEYLRRGTNDRVQEWTGPATPYENSPDDPNSLEGAAQQFGDNYSGRLTNCEGKRDRWSDLGIV